MPYFRIFAVALVVMGLSHTIAKERIFAGFREACGRTGELAQYLVSCPFCLSYWLAFVCVPLTGTYAIEVDWRWSIVSKIGSWLFSSVFIAIAAAFLRVAFYLIDENQGLLRRREKIEDLVLERERDEAPESVTSRRKDRRPSSI